MIRGKIFLEYGGSFMFLKIHLKNFRSFSDLEFDLSQKKNAFNHFAIVYGENGMGKSNLTCGIAALIDLMRTMDVRDIIESLLSDERFRMLNETFGNMQTLPSSLGIRDIQSLVQEYRMIGSTEPVLLEYEFIISGKKGKYLIELGDSEIIHERLEYTLERNRGVYFDLSTTSKKINANIFKNSDVLQDIKYLVNRFWGKHSLLAIIMHEKNDKSEHYINEGLSDRFYDLMHQLSYLSYCNRIGSGLHGMINNRLGFLESLTEGQINKSNEKQLDLTEHALSHLFNAINSDNRRLYYIRNTVNENYIQYELFIKKFISGQERDISFKKESTGNHQLLRIFPLLLNAMMGGTVVIDEIETGIHDMLMKKILDEIVPHIKGQLIITSHNTSLMEMENALSSVYILKEDEMANKTIKCINSYDERTYQQNSIRKKYLDNKYGGVPDVRPIDFSALLEILELNSDDYED